MYSIRSCGRNAAQSWVAPANFRCQHILHCANKALDCTIVLRVKRRGMDMVVPKALQLMPEGTNELSPIFCGHPCRHTIAHEPVVMNSTRHSVSTAVKDGIKSLGFGEVVHHKGI